MMSLSKVMTEISSMLLKRVIWTALSSIKIRRSQLILKFMYQESHLVSLLCYTMHQEQHQSKLKQTVCYLLWTDLVSITLSKKLLSRKEPDMKLSLSLLLSLIKLIHTLQLKLLMVLISKKLLLVRKSSKPVIKPNSFISSKKVVLKNPEMVTSILLMEQVTTLEMKHSFKAKMLHKQLMYVPKLTVFFLHWQSIVSDLILNLFISLLKRTFLDTIKLEDKLEMLIVLWMMQ